VINRQNDNPDNDNAPSSKTLIHLKNENTLPLELVSKLIQYASNENDLVCDFFLGGFKTATACEMLNRRVCGYEINPFMYKRGMMHWTDSETATRYMHELIEELELQGEEPSRKQIQTRITERYGVQFDALGNIVRDADER